MTKKKAKTKETLILIRIPDIDDRQGIGTLTIQCGELGHIQEFDYKGLTLKGNIAEAVGNALLKLAQVEAAPPPNIAPEKGESVSSQLTPEAAEADDESVSDDILPDEDENPSESAEIGENPPENPQNPSVSTETAITDTDDKTPEKAAESTAKPPQKVSVSALAELSVNPSDNQQMSLF